MTYILLAIVIVLLGLALWRLAAKASEADEDLKGMNQGRTNGIGIFGIFRKDHR